MVNPLPIAVLISGGGTTLQNLIQQQRQGELDVDIRCVVTSNLSAAGNEIAKQAGIPVHVAERPTSETAEEFRDAVFGPCRAAGVELVVMGGFLKHVLIPEDFVGRVINIHPALVPAFSGKGFYGKRVHEAIIDKKVAITGCTVHFVDDEYDHGPTILQRTVKVLPGDTAESLAARVYEQECIALPEAIRLYASGKARLDVP